TRNQASACERRKPHPQGHHGARPRPFSSQIESHRKNQRHDRIELKGASIMKDVLLILGAVSGAIPFALGCADKSKQTPTPTYRLPPAVTAPRPTEGELRADVEEQQSANSYRVRLRWTNTITTPVAIYRSRAEERPELLVTLEPSAHEYVDTTVSSGN